MKTINRNRILHIFDMWIRQPGAKIDLIRTTHGQPIYFSGFDHGHNVCMIEYKLVNLQITKA